MKRVCVLLSIYNGEQYLKQQLDSILNQTGVSVHILARDDGSTDKSVELVKSYISADIELIEGDNIGSERSFNKLLKLADCNKYDYFAFADQDDVWFNNKLYSAAVEIGESDIPTLFCANQIITDQYLHEIQPMIPAEKYLVEKKRTSENYFLNRHGCTMVWNKSLMKILSEIQQSNGYISYHDKWVNLVARISGIVIVTKEPLQLYRIHNANVSGYEERIVPRIKKGIKLYWKRDNHCNLYARDCVNFLEQHPQYKDDSEGQKYLYQVASYRDSLKKRLALVFTRKQLGKNFFEQTFWRISILIAKY